MNITLINYRVWILLCLFLISACKDSPYLDAKYNQSLVVPEMLDDWQSLLDNDRFMNGAGSAGLVPSIGEVASDSYYLQNLNGLSKQNYRNLYLWSSDPYAGESNIKDWNAPYRSIFYANVVLNGLKKLHVVDGQLEQYNAIKGMALFCRAHLFYQLLQVFASPYTAGADMQTPGIVLRLDSDVGEILRRSSIGTCYQQVLTDLNQAAGLLPTTQPSKTRPSKAAALALLARVYLSMQNYSEALRCADECLKLPIVLLDYQQMASGISYPFPRFNSEVIYHCTLLLADPLLISIGIVNQDLYDSYNESDLRKQLFFKKSTGGKPGYAFRGSYDGSSYLFGGLTTSEVYLIRAEAEARAGKPELAMQDVNELRKHRYLPEDFSPIVANSAFEALKITLTERRKELLFRGLRWTDLRRLNQDPVFEVILRRVIDHKQYSIAPNSKNYTFPIPYNVLNFNKDMPQNPREEPLIDELP